MSTGRAWERQVIDLAHLYGWRVAHFRTAHIQRKGGSTYHATPVGADGKGFPDLVLVRGSRLIFAELKSGTGRLSAEQADWMRALGAAGATTFIWRPQYLDDVIGVLSRPTSVEAAR